MAEPAVRRMPSGATDQSIGDLVSVAARDISQLLRYEIDLAKLELKSDVKRAGIGAGLLAIVVFAACLLLMLLCFAFAYGLVALGVWIWAAFLIVAGTCVLLAGAAVGIAYLKVRRLSGLSKTRKTVGEGLEILRLNGKQPDGQHPEITASKTP